MKRRDFMMGLAGALATSVSLAGAKDSPRGSVSVGGHSTRAGRGPNMVFILADDCTFNEIGCFGGGNVKTPNIDRLAGEGVRFTRAYASMSMCSPFRAELYTGLYPAHNGVTWNHANCKFGTKSVCHHLGALGYRVALSGKKDARPPATFPFVDLKGFPAEPEIRDFIAKDSERPFCLFLCSSNPHAPWTTGDASKIDPDAIQLAPVQHDNSPTREAMRRYLAEVGDLDREVGEILAILEETGRARDTLVMFSSEQGWALGYAKWSNWNIGVHTGLVARWPGHIEPGTQTDALVQMCDVLPTFIDAAGGDVGSFNLDGESFLKVLTGRAKEHRRYVYCMHNNVPEGEPYPIRSIRDGEFHYLMNLKNEASYHEKHVMAENSRLVWWPALMEAVEKGDARAKMLMEKYQNRPAEELYRVERDVYELKNLADDPQYAEVKARLRSELERWMAEQDDPGAALDDLAVYTANREASGLGKKGAQKKKAAPKK